MFLRLAVLLLTLSLAGPALAQTTYVYSDYSGPSVTFTGIQETVHTGDESALFEAPTGVGDTLTFDPSAFIAESSSGEGLIQAHSTLQLMLETTNQTISALELSEAGDYTFGSFPPVGATAATGVIAGLGGVVTVVEAFGAPITPVLIGFDDDDVTFTGLGVPFPSIPGGAYLPDAGLGTTAWTATLFVDIAAHVEGATKIVLSLNNILQANSEASPATSAQIQKKAVAGPAVTITPIPEPSLVALLGLALAGLAARRHLSR